MKYAILPFGVVVAHKYQSLNVSDTGNIRRLFDSGGGSTAYFHQPNPEMWGVK